MDSKEIFSKRLVQLREDRGITQQTLADDLKITRQSLSLYEKAERTINIDLLVKIANYFDVSTDYLMGLSNNENNQKNMDDITIGEAAKTAETLTGLNQNTISKLLNLNMNLKEYIEVINELFEHNELLIDFFVRLFELASFSYVSLKCTEDLGIQKDYRHMADENRYRLHFTLEKLMDIYDYDVLYSVNLAPYAELELNEVRKELERNGEHNPKKE
ncbi:MAG: helix-turn-helix domain-containing protein [Oscillospiraceae bacterium]